MSVRLVITGAPASGKTECLARLSREPDLAGWVFFSELARSLLQENPALRQSPAVFHREIYHRQVAREASVGGRHFISDRGTIDAFAFHPRTIAAVGTTLSREYRRYTAVIQLGSCAALGRAYYRNDSIRTETPAEAMAIEEALRGVWSGHPRYAFVAAAPDMKAKYLRLRELVRELVNEARCSTTGSVSTEREQA